MRQIKLHITTIVTWNIKVGMLLEMVLHRQASRYTHISFKKPLTTLKASSFLVQPVFEGPEFLRSFLIFLLKIKLRPIHEVFCAPYNHQNNYEFLTIYHDIKIMQEWVKNWNLLQANLDCHILSFLGHKNLSHQFLTSEVI